MFHIVLIMIVDLILDMIFILDLRIALFFDREMESTYTL
jgi:hypothetical protein